jgi:aryl-alcohol dehydrogenase
MMAGKISGCTKVIAIDRVSARLDLAKELGATDVINTTDMVKAIQNLIDGKGVDYIIDTTGVTQVMEDAIKALAQSGVLAAIAVTANHIDVNTWDDLCPADKTIIGVNMGDSIPQVDIPHFTSKECSILIRLKNSMTLRTLTKQMPILFPVRPLNQS